MVLYADFFVSHASNSLNFLKIRLIVYIKFRKLLAIIYLNMLLPLSYLFSLGSNSSVLLLVHYSCDYSKQRPLNYNIVYADLWTMTYPWPYIGPINDSLLLMILSLASNSFFRCMNRLVFSWKLTLQISGASSHSVHLPLLWCSNLYLYLPPFDSPDSLPFICLTQGNFHPLPIAQNLSLGSKLRQLLGSRAYLVYLLFFFSPSTIIVKTMCSLMRNKLEGT